MDASEKDSETWSDMSPLDCKEIKPVNPEGNQPWTFIGRTDAEAEAPALWPPDVKNWLTEKDPDAGKDFRQKEKGVTEDKIDSITASMDMSLSKFWEILKDRKAWCAAAHGVSESRTQFSNWTTFSFLFHIGVELISNVRVCFRCSGTFVFGVQLYKDVYLLLGGGSFPHIIITVCPEDFPVLFRR